MIDHLSHPCRSIAAALVATLIAGSVGAEPIDIATETDPTVLYEYGRERYAAGDTLDAYEAYKRSCDIRPTMEACGNGGNAAFRLGRYAAAATMLRLSASLVPASIEQDEVRKKIDARLSEATAKCGTLHLDVQPAGATISVDDIAIGPAPLEDSVFVDAGKHRIAVRGAGYGSAERTIDVGAGKTVTESFVLAANAVGELELPQDSDNTTRTVLGIGGLVLGAVGVGVGIGLYAAAEQEIAAGETLRNDIAVAAPTATNPCGAGVTLAAMCGELGDTQDAHNALLGGSIGAFVAGGAFAAAGLTALLVGPGSENVEATAIVTPGLVGGSVRVKF